MTNPMDYYPGNTPHKLKDFIDTDKMRSKGMKWVGWDKEDYLIWITPDGMMHRFKELPRSDIGKEYERYIGRKVTCLGDGSPSIPSGYMWQTKYIKNRDGAITSHKSVKRDLYEAEFEACKSCALCIERDGVASDDSTGSSVAGGDGSGGISIDDDGPGNPTSYGTTDYSTAGGGYGTPGGGMGDDAYGGDGSEGNPVGGGTNWGGSATTGTPPGSGVTDPAAKADILNKVGLGMAGSSNNDTWVDRWVGKEKDEVKKNANGQNWKDGLTVVITIRDRNGNPMPVGTTVPFSLVNAFNPDLKAFLSSNGVKAGTTVTPPSGGGKMVVIKLDFGYNYDGNDVKVDWNTGEQTKLRDYITLNSYTRENIEPPKKDVFTPTPPQRTAYQPPTWQPMRPVTLPPPRIRLMQPYPPPRPPRPPVPAPPPPPPPPPITTSRVEFSLWSALFKNATVAFAELRRIVTTLQARPDIVVEITANSGHTGNPSDATTFIDENSASITPRNGGTYSGLMQARANFVRNQLIRVYGIDPNRIRVAPGRTKSSPNVTFRFITR
jgi:hypothetical protein